MTFDVVHATVSIVGARRVCSNSISDVGSENASGSRAISSGGFRSGITSGTGVGGGSMTGSRTDHSIQGGSHIFALL